MEERKEPQGAGELVTERARIAGVEAGIAAGLVAPADALVRSSSEQTESAPGSAPAVPDDRGAADGSAADGSAAGSEDNGGEATAVGAGSAASTVAGNVTGSHELPSWSDPPTLQVPRVLLDLEQEAAAGRTGPPPPPPGGPVWRERQEDWNDTDEVLADLAGLRVTDYEESSSDDPFAYDFLDAGEESSWVARPEAPTVAPERISQSVSAGLPASVAPEVTPEDVVPESTSPPVVPDEANDAEIAAPIARRRRHAAPRNRPSRSARPVVEPKPPRAVAARNPVVATVTGFGLAAVVLLCFFAGPPAVLAMVAVAATLATAELFNSLRLGGYQPATLVALVAVPAVIVAAYFRGPSAIVTGLVIYVASAMIWYLAGITRRSPVANLSVTVFGFVWIGVFGAFVGLLLDPSIFPHRHGIAFLIGAMIAVVGYDVGGYAVGSIFGRHRLAPGVSPNKTWEGLIGGCVVAIAASVGITSQIHPWHVDTALVLGLIVAAVAPFGDLLESMIKRDLGVKDMGSLLPGHGGMLDRIDALLLVLPATYYFVRLAHIG